MKVFKIAYCDYYDPSLYSDWSGVCREFVEAVSQHQPDMLKKQKVHLLLHLVECMEQFGPTSAFNSERYGFVKLSVHSYHYYPTKIVLDLNLQLFHQSTEYIWEQART